MVTSMVSSVEDIDPNGNSRSLLHLVMSAVNVFFPSDGEYVEKGPGHIVRNGSGIHTSATGTVYSGEWTSDVLNGKG